MASTRIELCTPMLSCYTGCVENELVALHNRHLISRIQPNGIKVRAVAKAWLDLIKPFRYRVWSDDEVIRNTSPDKRKRVANALKQYREEGLSRRDERISAFIKHEKAFDMPDDPAIEKSPRMIQYRSFVYTSVFKKYLMPFEHKFWKIGRKCEHFADPSDRLFSKTMNSWGVAANLRKAWESYAEPVADLWDVSRMDAHLSGTVRELIEFKTYYKMTGAKGCFEYFTRTARKNKCRTRNGIKYEMEYTLCSGEANTSLADSIVMAAALHSVYRGNSTNLVNGDDCVAVREASQPGDDTVFADCGLPVKYEAAYVFEHVEFCQQRPVEVRPGIWRMVRNPDRVMSRSLHTIKTFAKENEYMNYLASIGQGELASNDGVPVLQSFALALMRLGKVLPKVVAQEFAHRREQYRGVSDITDVARVSFAVAWGIAPETQLELERFFDDGGLIPYIQVSL